MGVIKVFVRLGKGREGMGREEMGKEGMGRGGKGKDGKGGQFSISACTCSQISRS